MSNPQIISTIIGVCISGIIYWLVRRDHLAPGQAFRWLFIAVVVIILGVFPVIVDSIGNAVGISYPPIIPTIIGLGAALIKILLMDIERNKMNVSQSRIIQKLAILEEEINQLRKAAQVKEKP